LIADVEQGISYEKKSVSEAIRRPMPGALLADNLSKSEFSKKLNAGDYALSDNGQKSHTRSLHNGKSPHLT
jgi:hypothetical protein